MKDTSM